MASAVAAKPGIRAIATSPGSYDTSLAFDFPSVLSIPYGLTKAVPLLKQALTG